ncbi:MAG: hypothetical protein CMJ18_00880 [Phycisphaeraceae bacterium]|nr:hypothetical protein [Phycisphaeraceae bacterium]
MALPWAIDEMKGVDLKDARLNHRVVEVLSRCGGHPTASIPLACEGYAEMAATYRFFDNDKVNFDNVMQPHMEATRRRMAEQSTVILAQDTTEIDLTRPHQQMGGAGPLDGGARRGLFLHPLHAFTPDGTPLGTVRAKVWTRDDKAPISKPREAERLRRKHTPIEEKESQRWIEMMRQSHEEAKLAPDTHFVSVADSEADIYELLVEAQTEPRHADWIVRSGYDRALDDVDQNESEHGERTDTTTRHLRKQALASDVLFTQCISVRGREAKTNCEDHRRRQPRKSRHAEVEVRAASVKLRPPWRPDRKLPPISVNVVLVREINPPANEPPVEWMLLTSLPIDDVEQVRQVIEYYCVRWMIEVFFRTLKSGCRVEERLFEHVDRLLPCLAIYLIVTWRTLLVCRLGREFPDISCDAIFDPAEWQSICQVIRREPPPAKPPSLKEMVRMVAQLGGYVNRKRKGEPGPQTVWLGLQRLHDIARCWEIFGPGAESEHRLV